jgi:hypothetical protein
VAPDRPSVTLIASFTGEWRSSRRGRAMSDPRLASPTFAQRNARRRQTPQTPNHSSAPSAP